MFPNLPRVVEILNQLRSVGLVTQYAIGGAYAVALHSEPLGTEDLDVFCHLSSTGLLVDVSPIYAHLKSQGYFPIGDAVEIEDVPVQFLPAPTKLVNEAIDAAIEVSIEGAKTRVFDLEYLLAIALDLGRPKDRERIEQMLSVTTRPIDHERLGDILMRHAPDRPKAGEQRLLDRWVRYLEARSG